jgi:hypothetical protein
MDADIECLGDKERASDLAIIAFFARSSTLVTPRHLVPLGRQSG